MSLLMARQQERSEETRIRILEAAEKCFAQKGYDATSVMRICQTAGLSKGAVYHHFSSKEDLFVALLRRWLDGLDAQLAVLRENKGSIPEGLLAMTEIVREILQSGERQLPMYLEFYNKAARDHRVWRATLEPYRRYREYFSQMIQSGISEGSMRAVDPDSVATIIVSLGLGLLIQGLLDPTGADWEKVSYEGLQILLQGLRKP